MPERPELPGLIRIKRNADRSSIQIDGQDFPWHVSRGSVHVNVNPDEVPSITLTIPADRVVIDDDFRTVTQRREARMAGLQELTDLGQAVEYAEAGHNHTWAERHQAGQQCPVCNPLGPSAPFGNYGPGQPRTREEYELCPIITPHPAHGKCPGLVQVMPEDDE